MHPHGGHTFLVVYREMIAQICLDYPGLPDVLGMSAGEIKFFYDAIRGVLKKRGEK